jgi:Right handed beta helix region
MQWYLLILSFLLFSVTGSSAQTPLSGELSGVYKKGEYVISGMVYVLPSNTLTFLPGTKIYFDKYSELTIEGSLICEGTKDSTILFESESALTPRLPETMDWNGITCSNSAERVSLSYCTIAHSVYGLKIDVSQTSVSLSHVVFKDNGTSSLSRDGKAVFAPDSIPVSYDCKPATSDCILIKDTSGPEGRPSKQTTPSFDSVKKKHTWRFPVRIALGAASLAGAGILVLENSRAEEFNTRYGNDSNGQQAVSDRNERDKAVAIRNTGAVLCALCITGFGITFLF